MSLERVLQVLSEQRRNVGEGEEDGGMLPGDAFKILLLKNKLKMVGLMIQSLIYGDEDL